jgi:hypothetical protein
MELKFRRVITGFRCHETDCFEQGVWYIETDAEFFHWCGKHAVTYMADIPFWESKIPGLASSPSDEGPSRTRKRRKPARNVRMP